MSDENEKYDPVVQGLAEETLSQVLGVQPEERNLAEQMSTVRAKVANYLERNIYRSGRIMDQVQYEIQEGRKTAQEFKEKVDRPNNILKRATRYFNRAVIIKHIADKLPAQQEKRPRQVAEEIVSYLEDNGSSLIYRRIYKSGDQKPKRNIDYSSLSLPEVTSGFASLKDPLKAIQKAESLMGLSWELRIDNRTAEAVFGFLRDLEDIPDKVIHDVRKQISETNIFIDGYGVYDNHYGEPTGDGELPKDIAYLRNVLQRGGFTNDERTIMHSAYMLGQLMERRYSNITLARAMFNAEYIQDVLRAATWVIRVIDDTPRREHYYQGDRYKLESYKLEEIVDAIISNKYWINLDYINRFENAQIDVSPEDILLLPDSLQYEKETTENDSKEVSSLDFKVLSDEEMTQLSRDERVTYYRKRAKAQVEALSSPNLTNARTAAAHAGEKITTENLFYYLDVVNIIQESTIFIDQLTDSERLALYRDITKKFNDSTYYHEHVQPHIIQYGRDGEQVNKLAATLVDALRKKIFSKSGQVSRELITQAYEQEYCTDKSLLEYLPKNIREYISYYVNLPEDVRAIIGRLKDRFNTLYVNGKETQELMIILAESLSGKTFINFLTKERLSILLGPENAKRFLSALPKKNDERRNALTHNPYDRTSALLLEFCYSGSFNHKESSEYDLLAEYIAAFGLARSSDLFRSFKAIRQYEQGEITLLPDVLIKSEVKSIDKLLSEVNSLREAIMSDKPLTAKVLSILSPLQMQLLEVITGKTTHRFDAGRPSFDSIVQDYTDAEQRGEILPVPKGHRVANFKLTDVTIEFDAEPIKNDFESLRKELLESIQYAGDASDLVKELLSMLDKKINDAEKALASIPEKGRPAAFNNLDRLKLTLTRLSESSVSIDQLLVIMFDINLGKGEQAAENSIKRRLVLRRVFQRHLSPGFIQDLQINLNGEVTPAAILSALNVIDELVKQHALNLNSDREGASTYWDDETMAVLKSSKSGKKLHEVFSGTRDKLKKAVDDFVYQEDGNSTEIAAIPSRDFTGEVSGYIADVCYTKEYPLLKDRPVVPYKFVIKGETAGKSELGGSVLVFDVTDESGEECLLVRGFDFKNETEINITQLIEKFLDEMAVVAKARNKTKVLIPGTPGAISNYPITLNHLSQTYITTGNRVSLAHEFRFNDYDLTNICFVARRIS